VSNIRKTLISIALFLFFFSLISNAYAATPISDCTIINSPGEYYLTQDIIDLNNSTCIIINSSSVQLDCKGYSIIAANLSTYYDAAISVGGDNVSILNCSIGAYSPIVWANGINLLYGFGNINISYIYVNSTDTAIFAHFNRNVRITNGYIVALTNGATLIGYNFYLYNLTLIGISSANYGLDLLGVWDSVISNLVITGFYYAFNLDYGTGNCQIVNNTIYNVNTAFGDWTYGDTSNFIYNNIINVTKKYFYGSSFIEYWNTTLTEGTNIVGGPYIGGNYWGKSGGTGYSDTCIDANHDGICDQPYDLLGDGSNIDYLPLAKYTPPPSFSVVFNYNSVDFGTVTPNTIAEAKSINYNVSVVSSSDYKVSVNATDWSGPTTIPADTLYFAVNDTLDKLSFATAKQLSNAVQLVATFPSTVTTNYHAFYFNVPVVPIGTYTATVTITYEVV
jgi:hypothetical protein